MAKSNNKVGKCTLEDVRIIYRNLEGRPDKYHTKGGHRTCSVVLPTEELAEQLIADGWPVKKKVTNDEGDYFYHLPVKANFESNNPPRIYLVTGKKKRRATEETVSTVDYANIDSVDVVISPYQYDVGGNKGISAYIDVMYVNIELDELAKKYDFDDAEEVPFEE